MKLEITTWIIIHFSVLEYYRKNSFIYGNIYSQDGRRFRCPLDPLTDRYADPTDSSCVRYFLCHLGHAFPRRCDVRRAFHPVLKECYPRYQIPEDLCRMPVDCDYNGYMVDPEDCTKYFICFFHQAIHYSCLTNFYFDPKKSLCIKDAKKSKECSQPKGLNGPSPKHEIFHRGNYNSNNDKRVLEAGNAASIQQSQATPIDLPNEETPVAPLSNSNPIPPSLDNSPSQSQPSTIDVEDSQTEQNDQDNMSKTRRQALDLNEPSAMLISDYN